MDANLASIHSIEEYHKIQSIVVDNTAENQKTWIGGSDCQEVIYHYTRSVGTDIKSILFYIIWSYIYSIVQENAWFWIDGTPFKFTNWCAGDPDDYNNNQRCIQINYGGKSQHIIYLKSERWSDKRQVCWNILVLAATRFWFCVPPTEFCVLWCLQVANAGMTWSVTRHFHRSVSKRPNKSWADTQMCIKHTHLVEEW